MHRPRFAGPGLHPRHLYIGAWVGLLLASACSTLGLREAFSARGDVIEVGKPHEAGGGADADAGPVRLFLETAPEGFDRVGREPVVQTGYGHRVLGRVELRLDRGSCDPGEANHLSREAVFYQLRQRAQKEGGDAVIYIETRAEDAWMSDCARLDRVGLEAAMAEPWAEGWVVRLEPAGAAAEARVDASLSAPLAGDAGVSAPLSPLPADASGPAFVDAGLGDAALPLPEAAGRAAGK